MRILKPFQAPHSYVFEDPDTGRKFRAATEAQLIAEIVSYREQNGKPKIENLSVVLQNYWCDCPENVGKCRPYKLQRGYMSFIHGGVALLKWVYYGEDGMVDQATAEERAGVCVYGNHGEVCPQNQFPDRTRFEIFADHAADAATHGRSTSLDKELGNCMACSCVLRAKVHYGRKITLTDQQLAEMPEFCWQKKVIAEQEKQNG